MHEQSHPPFSKESAFRWACAMGRLAGGHADPVEVIWEEPRKKSLTLKEKMDYFILSEVQNQGGNQQAAAKKLKCSRGTVHNALKRIGFALLALVGVFQAKAQPEPPSASAPALVATTKSNGVINLTWTRSGNSNDVGYKVWFGAANAVNLSSFSVGNQTNATIGSLIVGATYKAYVTAYDATGTDGIPSNELKAVAVLPNAGNVGYRVYVVAYDGVGASGLTNYWQRSTNLTIWMDIPGATTWTGDGKTRTLLRTNTGPEFIRISAR